MEKLLSLSPSAARQFGVVSGKKGEDWYCTHDPEGQRLGSGGGTAHLLREAWRARGGGMDFAAWLTAQRRIVLHAGGQSRRLPAYAPVGKSLLPVPVLRWSKGQRLDQTLVDLQLPLLERIMERGGAGARWCIASGDVMVMSERLPAKLPDVDVLLVGLWDEADVARKHGVFFTRRDAPSQLRFMLQKPAVSQLRTLAQNHYFLLDVGIWILSDRAMRIVLERSGALEGDGALREYDLYGTFGPCLGAEPVEKDAQINALSTAVLALEDGVFYHFGSNRDLIRSTLRLQNRVIDQRRIATPNIKPHPSLFVQNSQVATTLQGGQANIWIENAQIGAGWQLSEWHILTGIPENDWQLRLAAGQCVDCVPLKGAGWALRCYGIDDSFRGPVGAAQTQYLGASLGQWLSARGLSIAELGLDPQTDLQAAALFPVVDELSENWVRWVLDAAFAATPEGAAVRGQYLAGRRISADQLSDTADIAALAAQRKARLLTNLRELARNAGRSVFHNVDLEHVAHLCAANGIDLEPQAGAGPQDLFSRIHTAMFHARVADLAGIDGRIHEADAFAILRTASIESLRDEPCAPRYNCLEDQIIWGRSPVRLDLAGGWTDTPPYCFLNGGRVVNVAVELNGQPPIQVFTRLRSEPSIVLRSIDLGVSQEITQFEQLSDYAQMGSGFAIPKAALALSGLLPQFHVEGCAPDLRSLLEGLGGGLELNLLCAVPKGSGLGTSSILAATVLGVLSELFQLGWDSHAIGKRVLVLEQMLTSGGGWQDQYGGLLRGIKYLETKPGMDQSPRVRWLPDYLMTDPALRHNVLLYYTGITRMAKTVLGEIVRGMFLNHGRRLQVLERIGANAERVCNLMQEGKWAEFGAAIERSWQLNQQLDPGTNTPEIQGLIDKVQPHLAGKKLLGAGGGGYLLMVAHDSAAAARVKELLTQSPPNSRARFVDMRVSDTGLQVTRS